MNKLLLEQRTRMFAVRVVRWVDSLKNTMACRVLGGQLLRAATSIGANYREANRAESHADFLHKMAIVEKEAAETQYWLEVLTDAGLGDAGERTALVGECAELVAIFTSAMRTLKSKPPRS